VPTGTHNRRGCALKNRARETKPLEDIEDPVASGPESRASGVQARAARRVSLNPPVREELAERPLVSLGAPADPALLEPTYAYLSAYCFACLAPPVAQRLNVAIYELYANALRYGTDRGEVRLELRRSQGSLELRVTNHAEPHHVERLKAQINHVGDDPGAAFSDEMDRFSGASQPAPMLGLVRIAHEAGLPLELRCDDQLVEISTRCDG